MYDLPGRSCVHCQDMQEYNNGDLTMSIKS